jgi:hypothetical protein
MLPKGDKVNDLKRSYKLEDAEKKFEMDLEDETRLFTSRSRMVFRIPIWPCPFDLQIDSVMSKLTESERSALVKDLRTAFVQICRGKR